MFQERRITLNSPGPFPINITILALEPNRTLTLQMVYVSGIAPAGFAIFFMNQIDIVIVDADVPSKQIRDGFVVFYRRVRHSKVMKIKKIVCVCIYIVHM